MNPPETQSDFESKYFDPEGPDASEQEFSASLEKPAERPRFVVDAPEDSGTELNSALGQSPCSAQPCCPPILDRGDPEQGAGATAIETEDCESDWRDQVSAKVNRYKSRRPREDRYPSLQLKFESDGYRSPGTEEGAICTALSFSQSIPPKDPGLQPRMRDTEPQCFPKASLEATARVLEFPRSGALPVRRDDQLADPVGNRPRIVEAPELLPPPPAMGGILIEEFQEPELERCPGFNIPLQSAQLSRRLLAGAIDAVVVLIALSGFGYVFFRITGSVPLLKMAASLTAGLLGVLWITYQYAFLVFSGTTPGLRLAGLQVSGFDGTPASRNLRRWRVLASLLSCVSLGLGYAWCFLDEDQLSWHDRITKTHLAEATIGK
jgi:uncharacterized RDD family membrane protein YckC